MSDNFVPARVRVRHISVSHSGNAWELCRDARRERTARRGLTTEPGSHPLIAVTQVGATQLTSRVQRGLRRPAITWCRGRSRASALLAGRQRWEDAYDGRSQQKRPTSRSFRCCFSARQLRPCATSCVACHRAVRLWRGACRLLRAVEVVAARTVHEKTRARRRRRKYMAATDADLLARRESSSDDRRRHRALRGALRGDLQSAVEATLRSAAPILFCDVGRGGTHVAVCSSPHRAAARGDGRRDAPQARWTAHDVVIVLGGGVIGVKIVQLLDEALGLSKSLCVIFVATSTILAYRKCFVLMAL